MQQTHHPKVSRMTAAGNGVGVCSCGIPTVEELASLLQGHGPIDFRLCRSRERRPARAKSRDAFLEKGGRMNGTASESLSSGGGGGSRAERSAHRAKRARVEKIVGGMTGSPVGEMKRDRAQSPQVSHKRFLAATLPEERQPTRNCSSDTAWRDAPSDGESPRCDDEWTHHSLADGVFKSRLARAATSTGVESVFQKASAESSPNAHRRRSGRREVRGPAVQTEALSLVVPRRGVDGSRRSPSGAEPEPDRTRSAIRRRGKGGGSEFDEVDPPHKSAKVPSRVGSGSRRSPATHVTAAESSVCFPRVKMEPRGLLRAQLYSLNEALTADHLKKAKLMFFYTRYPSWRVLRLCFRDVQFTRRGASRLIKWFSNFREFYYIQVERFARRALAEGAAEARPLSVGRESQLFRVLKGHYDKGGRFQVPDGFLEVAELTLRQFYTAVSTGKDRDPSWKKAIYKVICKLDADLPAQFVPYGPGGPADDLTSGLPRRRRRLTPAF